MVKPWYSGLIDFNPQYYKYAYDTSTLVDGDMLDNVFKPWVSNQRGFDSARYQPTGGYGEYGERKKHWNYTKGVEGLPYYRKFGEDILDENGNFTPLGELWAKAVDALLPANSSATFFDPNTKQIRKYWKATHNDAHGRVPLTFTNLRDYVNYVREDQILGARHNVFLNKGKRYFYTDENGKEHYVDPDVIDKYNVSEKPKYSDWNPDHTVYWEDYELTGPKDQSDTKKGGSVDDIHREGGYGFDWKKFGNGLTNILSNPDFIGAGRLAGNLINNARVYDEYIKGILPILHLTYNTHRQIVGDEATKLAYYKRAAQGQTAAARPMTSDMDRQIAYLNEAKRIGDELREKGDLVDNQEIRRTSDESNQHQWANALRATEVANRNIDSMAKANAEKHAVLAQKHSAQWSSIDNYLLGLETRKRENAELKKAIQDDLFVKQAQFRFNNDPELVSAKDALLKFVNDNSSDLVTAKTTPKYKKLKLAYDIALLHAYEKLALDRIGYLNSRGSTIWAKSGTKITKVKKDDLLYKSAEDIVRHFRRMSKLSLDALKLPQPKIEKLTSHPKGSTRRYLYGGSAPFTIYKPAVLGGLTATTTTRESGSLKSSASEGDALLTDMFKNLLSKKGLPSDTNVLYKSMLSLLAQKDIFGSELSTTDIQSMYLQQLLKLSQIEYNREMFDKVYNNAVSKDALGEYAISDNGKFIVLSRENGSLMYKDWKDIDGNKETPLRNMDLLNLRANTPGLAFDSLIFSQVSKGIGLSKIAEYLRTNLLNLGKENTKIENVTSYSSGQIKAGMQLLANAPDGDYKITEHTVTLLKQIAAALQYLKHILPDNMRNVVKAYAGKDGISETDLIQSLLGSKYESTHEISVSPLSGRAASKKDSEGSGDSGKVTPSVALAMGLGEKLTIAISDKTSDALKVNVVSLPLLNEQNHPMANATLKLVGDGVYSGLLDLGSATMGGMKISTNGLNNILIDRGRIYSAELPIDEQEYRNTGIIKPNLDFLKNIELADALVKAKGINMDNIQQLDAEQIQTINQIYQSNGLPIKYNVGGDGKPVLTAQYRRFAMLHATATEDVFENEDPTFNDGVIEVDSDNERSRFESMMKEVTGNDKYNLDNGIGAFGFRFSETSLYKGLIYVPMANSTISALAGTGYKDSPQSYNLIEAADLQAQFIRDKGLLIQGSINNLQ